jgi:hypothetical protein
MNKITFAIFVLLTSNIYASKKDSIPIVALLYSNHLEYSVEIGALIPHKSWNSGVEIIGGKGLFATGELGTKGGMFSLGYGIKTSAIMAGSYGVLGGFTYLKPWGNNTELKSTDPYYGFELKGNAVLFTAKLGYLKNSNDNITTFSIGFGF